MLIINIINLTIVNNVFWLHDTCICENFHLIKSYKIKKIIENQEINLKLLLM